MDQDRTMQDQGPESAEAFNNLGAKFAEQRRHEEAIECFTRAIEREPDFAQALNNLGFSLGVLQRYAEAAERFARAVEIKPDFTAAHNNLGIALTNLGRRQEAVQAFKATLRLDPSHAQAQKNLGVALRELGHWEEASACFVRALEVNPDSADTYNHWGIALAELGRLEEAVERYDRALQINPGFADAHNNLGNAFSKLERREEAIDCYQRAVRINPDFALAYNNLGLLLREIGRREDAINCFARALAIRPAFAEANNNLGIVYADLRQPREAIECFTRALEVQQDHALARAQRMHQQARICDWGAMRLDADRVPSLGITGGVVPPFALLHIEDQPARHRIRAERFAAETYSMHRSAPMARAPTKPRRLRLGYFSADFRDHATMFLMAKLFEVHDRDRFRLHAFSFGPQRSDVMQVRARRAFEAFHDVQPMSNRAIAALARDESIDVAIDLQGYTKGNRVSIFAHRAAPIQIAYLGYPGTMGAPFMDYLIADKTLIPDAQRKHYSEKIIYLPNSYQVNDNTRRISERAVTRAEVGLPEVGFVFCCFNNNYKITPVEFDIWMRLLRQVESSALWLLAGNALAESNLKREAAKRGVDPARLVFAGASPHAEHLARLRLADLFLDTFNCNAHTTASDALWVGLPVVTKLGQGLIARVAGSLLNASGLSELVTRSEEDYANLALELAIQPEKLANIRRKLAANRLTTPLFDTELFAKHIEAAYQQAYQRYFEGEEPDTIVVEG